MNKLEGLLYKKGNIDRLLRIWGKGINIYNDYIKECKLVAEDENRSSLERAEARKNIHESDIPLKHYITSHKAATREYQEYLIPTIKEHASEEEQKTISFQDMKAEVEKMSQIDIFAEYEKQPDNVELISINQDIEKHIELLKVIIEEGTKRANETDDPYEKAKLDLEVFKANLHLITNKKRLNERLEYYEKQFKPQYEKDMAECEKYLDEMLERAKKLNELGDDLQMSFMLLEYEKNKHDKEKLWLFYTAIRSKLNKSFEHMRKNKRKYKGFMHLAKPIIK